MNAPLCQAPRPELPQLLLELARRRCQISEQALSSLVDHAIIYGVDQVVQWVDDDPGLTFVPSWKFWTL